MSNIEPAALASAQLPGSSRIDGYQSLSQLSENRRVSVNTNVPQQDMRARMTSMLNAGEERNLIDKIKDIAANLFNAFRHELREALHDVGIRGESAADFVRGVSKAFSEAVRAGASVSDAVRVRAVEEFTNARQETITRMTLDLLVRVHVGKDAAEPEILSTSTNENETFEVTV